jgi:hypothetical protein
MQRTLQIGVHQPPIEYRQLWAEQVYGRCNAVDAVCFVDYLAPQLHCQLASAKGILFLTHPLHQHGECIALSSSDGTVVGCQYRVHPVGRTFLQRSLQLFQQ